MDIKNKVCSSCKISKDVLEFSKCDRYRDGLYSWCKSCKTNYSRMHNKKNPQSKEYYTNANKRFNHSKNGILSSMYHAQTVHSVTRGHKPPLYTRDELKEWLFSQELFHELYDKWVDNDYLKDLKPSVDRKDDYKGYSFDNIQLMTWYENRTKHYHDRKNGINNKASVAVNKFTKDGVFVCDYVSMSSASRDVGICATAIKRCCDKEQSFHSAGGFKWEYKNKDLK